jgi:hypothetical protein
MCVASLLAQDLKKLDAAGGFKQFKIGNDFSSYAAELDAATGRYTGTCCTTAFGMHVTSIKLEADNLGKLRKIMIDMCPDPQASLEVKQALQVKIFNAITEAFGSAGGDLQQLTNHFHWIGRRVTLEFQYDNLAPTCSMSLVYSTTLGSEYGQPNPSDY